MLIKYYHPDKIVYVKRKELKEVTNYEQLVSWYLHNEAHTLMSAGFLINFIQNAGLENSTAISIGVDFLKESFLNKYNGLKVDGYELDEDFVATCQMLNQELGFSNSYYAENILEENVFSEHSYNVGLLFQMDYNFNDEEYRRIIEKFYNANIKTLIILSPSIYSFSRYNTVNLIEFIWEYYNARKTKKHKKNAEKITYRRTLGRFVKLFEGLYSLSTYQRFNYPYGRIHLLKFDIGKK